MRLTSYPKLTGGLPAYLAENTKYCNARSSERTGWRGEFLTKGAAMKKMKQSERREAERWKAAVLFMCGIPVARIAEDNRVGLTIGAIHRLVADRNFQDERVDYALRLARLVALARGAPLGLAGFVHASLTKVALTSVIAKITTALPSDGQKVAAKEAMTRRQLLRDFNSEMKRQPIESENLVIMEKTGRQIVMRNIAGCPLEYLLARSLIPQWAYDTGLLLRQDFEAATIGGLRAFNPMKDTVDGGFASSSITEGQAMAIDRLGEAKAALGASCDSRDYPIIWALMEAAAIRGDRVRDWIAIASQIKAGTGDKRSSRHVEHLLFGLTRVAFVYDLCPSSEVNKHLSTIQRSHGSFGKYMKYLAGNNATPI